MSVDTALEEKQTGDADQQDNAREQIPTILTWKDSLHDLPKVEYGDPVHHGREGEGRVQIDQGGELVSSEKTQILDQRKTENT